MRLLPSFEGTVPQQLAFDNALLAAGEEVLRFWESNETAVVLGKGNRAAEWIDTEACSSDDVPVIRRDSGGGAVVIAAGCLNYTFVFSLQQRPAWNDVARSFQEILEPIAEALGASFRVPCDLVMDDRKAGGSAQRRTALSMLHHGTFLYDFDSGLAERYLRMPVRQPPYRRQRAHRDFLGNIPLSSVEIRERVIACLGTRC